MQLEYASLEAKNHELGDAFREKSKSQQHIQKLYQSLKAQVMATHVATAAGDEAEFTLQSARGDRFIDRLPGTRTGTANFNQAGISQQRSDRRPHGRADSRSSGSTGQQRAAISIGPIHASYLQKRGSRGTGGVNRKLKSWDARNVCANHSLLMTDVFEEITQGGTPSQFPRSRLPVLGGSHQNVYLDPGVASVSQASPIIRQPLGEFSRAKMPRRTNGTVNTGPLR